jgi:uncharacterized coiled-coil protein SlyX
MAIEPDIEIIRRLRVARAAHPKDGPTDRALAFAMSEIEALRSRVAAQDAELTRLRGLVGSLTDRLLVWKDTSPLLAEARAEVPR